MLLSKHNFCVSKSFSLNSRRFVFSSHEKVELEADRGRRGSKWGRFLQWGAALGEFRVDATTTTNWRRSFRRTCPPGRTFAAAAGWSASAAPLAGWGWGCAGAVGTPRSAGYWPDCCVPTWGSVAAGTRAGPRRTRRCVPPCGRPGSSG
jgi:hypothetical protein